MGDIMAKEHVPRGAKSKWSLLNQEKETSEEGGIANALKAEMLRMAPAPIALHDTNHNIVWANKAYEAETGLTLQEMAGQKCFYVWGLSKICRNCPVGTSLESGKPCEAELTPESQDHWPSSSGSWLVKATPVFNEDGSVAGTIESAIEVSALKQAEEMLRERENRLEEMLAEKEVLLKEVYHRVKNNLQVVSSLLNLQAVRIEEPGLKAAFQESQSRVRAMSMVHEALYKSDSLSQVNLKTYIRKLAHDLFQTYKTSPARVMLRVNAADILLNINEAIPCGLVLNELITNSLKYAFPDDREGSIILGVRLDGKKNVVLTFGDNGVGLPEDFDIRNAESLGLSLVVKLMEKQLHGTMQIERGKGLKYTFTFTPKAMK